MVQPVAHDKLTTPPGKSGCPINMTVELLGDRWSLIVLRDIMFSGATHFRELLSGSIEGIASNILAARLSKLVDAGLLTRDNDPSHRQKVEYHLTEAAIQLVPVMAQLGAWGARWLDTTPELTVRAELLAAGGPALWERFMAELRAIHLHGAPPPTDGVLSELTAAYEAAVRREQEAAG
ncbi:winged helix-turn-helix transcriptional regulator [Nocardia sp. NPDC059246]|uniref:winged helix-turn-helix transcriptional regulator n=1 Tax=unclassified Nocardia TaxID=2637762 RepID=UPI0036AF9B71